MPTPPTDLVFDLAAAGDANTTYSVPITNLNHETHWAVGVNLYCLLHQKDISGTTITLTIRVLKSTDSGATWTEQDSGNAPTCSFAANGTNTANTYLHTCGRLDGTLLWFNIADGSTKWKFVKFETATDLWAGDAGTSGSPPDYKFGYNSSNTAYTAWSKIGDRFHVAYHHGAASATTYYQYCDVGGTWSAQVDVSGGDPSVLPDSIVADSTGRAYIFFWVLVTGLSYGGGTDSEIHLATVESGTVSARSLVVTNNGFYFGGYAVGVVNGVETVMGVYGKVVYPVVPFHVSFTSGTHHIGSFYAPIGSSPSWTIAEASFLNAYPFYANGPNFANLLYLASSAPTMYAIWSQGRKDFFWQFFSKSWRGSVLGWKGQATKPALNRMLMSILSHDSTPFSTYRSITRARMQYWASDNTISVIYISDDETDGVGERLRHFLTPVPTF